MKTTQPTTTAATNSNNIMESNDVVDVHDIRKQLNLKVIQCWHLSMKSVSVKHFGIIIASQWYIVVAVLVLVASYMLFYLWLFFLLLLFLLLLLSLFDVYEVDINVNRRPLLQATKPNRDESLDVKWMNEWMGMLNVK